MCVKCGDNCQTCRSADYCYLCSSGFYLAYQQKDYTGGCLRCSDNCLTCTDTPTNCLTCKSGFSLSLANICINSDAIDFIIRLNLPFSQYSSKTRLFRRGFSGFINKQESFETQFQQVKEGSTIIDGYIAIPSD